MFVHEEHKQGATCIHNSPPAVSGILGGRTYTYTLYIHILTHGDIM